MFSRRLLDASLALALALPFAAQVPTELQAVHRAGQTFLTWREMPTANKRYRIYRSTSALHTTVDLKSADLLGEVDERSSRNQGRSLASGVEHMWIIEDAGAELAVDQGLFVYTAEAAANRAFYAVTSVQAGGENRTLMPGLNATQTGLRETPAAPEPVRQSVGSEGEVWGHWVGNRDTPLQPALNLFPSRGYDFQVQPGDAPGPHGLVLRLHAAGQTYLQAWPQRFETPQDVDILSFSDLMPYTSWSFWFGSHESLPAAPTADTTVSNYTQRRIAWTMDWLTARLGAAHDPERVYVIGGSMGAIGGMYLLNEYPERFAAALLRNGLYDLLATDYRNPDTFENLFGAFDLGLRTRDGLLMTQRTNAVFMAGRDLAQAWPIVRTLSGRNDETVGWMSAMGLFHGLAELGRPAVHYFDERDHNPRGYWHELEHSLLTRTFNTRRDRPTLRFTGCTLDDDAGDGTRTIGDAVGTINGYVDFDPKTASTSLDALAFEIYLRAQGVLDDAPEPTAWAALTPWRTGAFQPQPGEAVHYTLREQGTLVDEHLLFPDTYGHVRTPPVPLSRTRRDCRFERDTPATHQELFLGGAPIPGDGFQAVLRGTPGTSWTLFLALGNARGPNGQLLGGSSSLLNGSFGSSGVADLHLPLPRSLPLGSHLWARARIDQHLSAPRNVSIQPWPGQDPPRFR
ncbi:MAG: hypothetical protein EXS08_12415 [Planctomycetes bacterium]|nr:hypothetical protein [Planctomycetota bacterium]